MRYARMIIRLFPLGRHIVVAFRPITLWPFPEKRLHEILMGTRHVLTVEMNEGMLDGVVRQQAFGTQVTASNITQSDGQIIRMEDIIRAIKEAY